MTIPQKSVTYLWYLLHRIFWRHSTVWQRTKDMDAIMVVCFMRDLIITFWTILICILEPSVFRWNPEADTSYHEAKDRCYPVWLLSAKPRMKGLSINREFAWVTYHVRLEFASSTRVRVLRWQNGQSMSVGDLPRYSRAVT